MIEFYFGRTVAPGGYSWIFPKGDGIANVGVGVRNSPEIAYYYLKKFVSKFDATPVELNIGGVPLSGPIDKTYTDGFLVVGDAAGQVDPITGGGIHITASCARIAGEVAAEAIKEENVSSMSLKRYDDLWRTKFGDVLKNSLKIRKVIDKLSDNDINVLAEFFENNDLEKISKFGILKFFGKHPNLLKVLTEFL